MKAWIARDFDGILHFFTFRPRKSKYNGKWYICPNLGADDIIKERDLPQDINPQWEDEEAIEVELKIEKV